MRRATYKSSGFTLVELLVVISIIGVLMAMLLPAVSSARESARLAQCLNNNRQIGTAMQTFSSSNGCFPPGLPSCMPATAATKYQFVGGTSSSTPQACTCCGPNWEVAILPYIEESNLYASMLTCLDANASSFNACSSCGIAGTNSNNGVAWTAIGPSIPSPVFSCPDGGDNMRPFVGAGMTGGIAIGNYAANWGTGTWNPTATTSFVGTNGGMFDVVTLPLTTANTPQSARGRLGSRFGIRPEDVLDGTSNTMLISEVVGVQSPTGADMRGAWTWAAMGSSAFSAKFTPNAPWSPLTGTGVDDLPTVDNSALPPNNALMATQDSMANNWVAAARSNHASGFVTVGFADGSTHKFNDATNLTIWQAMATRANHESVQIPQ